MSFEPGGPVAINVANGRPNIARNADGELRIAAGKDSASHITFHNCTNGSTNAAERMRIAASGNVGIGGSYTTPKEKLHIVGAAVFDGNHATATNAFRADEGVLIHGAGNVGYITAVSNGNNDVDLQLRALNGGSANSNQLVLDSEGNVGIGTSSPSQALEVVKSGFAYVRTRSTSSGFTGFDIGQHSSGNIYLNNRDNTAIIFQTNNSARMRIDSTGRVGINRTPSITNSKLEVGGADNVPLINVEASGSTGGLGFGNDALKFYVGNSLAAGFSMGNSNKYNSGNSPGFSGSGANLRMEGDDSQIIMANNFIHSDNSGYTQFTLRAAYGAVNAAAVMNLDSGYMRFRTGTSFTEHMRLHANGTLTHMKGTDDIDTIGNVFGTGGQVYSSTTSSNNTYHYRDTTNTRYNFYVGGNGQVNARLTSIAQISDARLKENVRDYTVGLNDILKLKPRVFDWIPTEGEKDQVGFIAQEFEEVFPNWIGNFLHDDLEDAKSVMATEIIYPMVNAIKELKAEIDALKTEINVLKGE